MYSQREEEKYILEAVGDKNNGIFLDVGAYDGKSLSNTLALVERGWSGVLVEPASCAFNNLLELHGKNTKLSLVKSLVGNERGIVPFWECRDWYSSTNREFMVEMLGRELGISERFYVPQVTFIDLLRCFPLLEDADVVSIDTESTSADLFVGFPFELCRPRVFCVEHDKQPLGDLADRWGYDAIYMTPENLVFVRRD